MAAATSNFTVVDTCTYFAIIIKDKIAHKVTI